MNPRKASAVRFAIRAVLVCLTAFGLDLSADQVAAVQLVGEAVLQLHAQFYGSGDSL